MGILRDKMSRDLIIRGYSKRTQKTYLHAVYSLAKHYMISPDQLNLQQINQYQLYLIQEKNLSYSHYNVTSCALRFFYTTTLNRKDFGITRIPKLRPSKKSPLSLSINEVYLILNAVKNLKLKTIMMVMIASGLRISEVLNLRCQDIDSEQMLIRIVSGKRNKDRCAILPTSLLHALRYYWVEYPVSKKQWLFPTDKDENRQMGSTTINRALKAIGKKVAIHKKITTHALRHSFSTILLEKGVGIKQLQILLGHADLRSTMIYSQQAQIQNLKVISPLDLIYEDLYK
ncbi:MAG: tyrosine-type recombinase/integrase [Oligoflexales bacterium]